MFPKKEQRANSLRPQGSKLFPQEDDFGERKSAFVLYRRLNIQNEIFHRGDLVDAESAFPVTPRRVVSPRPRRASPKILRNRLAYELVEDARIEQESILAVPDAGIEFCHFKFQVALRARWVVMELERLQNVLSGNFRNEDLIEEFYGEKQFAKIYGPMDCTSEVYGKLLEQFDLQRKASLISMLQREKDLLELMIRHLPKEDRSAFVLKLKNAKDALLTSLVQLPEAKSDLNPVTNPARMDLFMVPRPVQTVSVYGNRTEFTLEDSIFARQGYNAAVYDVGLWSAECCPSSKRKAGTCQLPVYSREFLKYVKGAIEEYPLGIEGRLLIHKLRTEGFNVDDSIFGDFSETACHLSDAIFPQKLEESKLILFPSVLQGMIDSPKGILNRIWKRIEHLVDLAGCLELSGLQTEYEHFYCEPLYWGFESLRHLVEFCTNLFKEESEVEVKTGSELNEMLEDELV